MRENIQRMTELRYLWYFEVNALRAESQSCHTVVSSVRSYYLASITTDAFVRAQAEDDFGT